MNYSAIRAVFCNSGQQSQAKLRFYRGVCVLQKLQQSRHGDGRFCFNRGRLCRGCSRLVEALLELFTQLLAGILLDVRIGVDQQIGAGMARCALYRFHITAGDHQLIGCTGMAQTVEHNAGELRVFVLPLDELLADKDRLYRQTVGQAQEHPTVAVAMQRVQKVSLAKTGKDCILQEFEDKREGSTTTLVLKKTKTASSNRTIFMTTVLKEELKHWLKRLEMDEDVDPERYRNSGMLLRLPNGLAVEPILIRKKFIKWQDEHPEFEKIVFHGLRHSSATYQLIESGGNIKAVQGNTGHATTGILMDTYAHTQDKPRLELAEKIEANFYSQNVGSKPGSAPEKQNLPDASQITPEVMLTVVRQMNPEQRREFTRLLFA